MTQYNAMSLSIRLIPSSVLLELITSLQLTSLQHYIVYGKHNELQCDINNVDEDEQMDEKVLRSIQTISFHPQKATTAG